MSALELKVYDILKAQLGEQEARSVLDYIDERTAEQFNNYKSQLPTRYDLIHINEEINRFRVEFKGDLSQLRTELKEEIALLRTEVKDEIVQVRMELKEDISQVRIEFGEKITKEIAQVRVELGGAKSDIIKWMFIFWVGQFAAMLALFKFLR